MTLAKPVATATSLSVAPRFPAFRMASRTFSERHVVAEFRAFAAALLVGGSCRRCSAGYARLSGFAWTICLDSLLVDGLNSVNCSIAASDGNEAGNLENQCTKRCTRTVVKRDAFDLLVVEVDDVFDAIESDLEAVIEVHANRVPLDAGGFAFAMDDALIRA